MLKKRLHTLLALLLAAILVLVPSMAHDRSKVVSAEATGSILTLSQIKSALGLSDLDVSDSTLLELLDYPLDGETTLWEVAEAGSMEVLYLEFLNGGQLDEALELIDAVGNMTDLVDIYVNLGEILFTALGASCTWLGVAGSMITYAVVIPSVIAALESYQVHKIVSTYVAYACDAEDAEAWDLIADLYGNAWFDEHEDALHQLAQNAWIARYRQQEVRDAADVVAHEIRRRVAIYQDYKAGLHTSGVLADVTTVILLNEGECPIEDVILINEIPLWPDETSVVTAYVDSGGQVVMGFPAGADRVDHVEFRVLGALARAPMTITPVLPRFTLNQEFDYAPAGISVDASRSFLSEGVTLDYYEWDFGDSTESEYGTNASHVYEQPGCYTITLTAVTSHGTRFASKVIEVHNALSAGMVISPEWGICETVFSFDASPTNTAVGSIDTIWWDLGDGETKQGVCVTHQYSTEGWKTVTLTVANTAGATASRSQAIYIGSGLPTTSGGISVVGADAVWNMGLAPPDIRTTAYQLHDTLAVGADAVWQRALAQPNIETAPSLIYRTFAVGADSVWQSSLAKPSIETTPELIHTVLAVGADAVWQRTLSSQAIGRVVLIQPPTITPSGPYFPFGALTATFGIKNMGDAAIHLDKLLLGGRFDGGELPSGGYPDFTHESVTLQPGEEYQYRGTLTPPEAGNYHFFVAYYVDNPSLLESQYLDRNKWNTCVELGKGLTGEDRCTSLSVLYAPNPYGYSFRNNRPGSDDPKTLLADEGIKEQSKREFFSLAFDLTDVDPVLQEKWFSFLDESGYFRSGLCWGMAASSLMDYAYPEYDYFLEEQGKKYAYQMTEPLRRPLDDAWCPGQWDGSGDTPDPTLSRLLRFHLMQVSAPSVNGIEEVLECLLSDFPTERYIVCVRDEPNLLTGYRRGHALIPYFLETISESQYRLHVYDPNYPGEFGHAIVIERGIFPRWKWTYQLSSLKEWAGPSLADVWCDLSLVAVPISGVYNSGKALPLPVSDGGPSACVSLLGEGTLMAIDSLGRSTGYDGVSYINGIPNATIFLPTMAVPDLGEQECPSMVLLQEDAGLDYVVEVGDYVASEVIFAKLGRHYTVSIRTTGDLQITVSADGRTITMIGQCGDYSIDAYTALHGLSFAAKDIYLPTSAIHSYTIDWEALEAGEEGVNIKVDGNGDGSFDDEFTSDAELTQSEFLAETTFPVPALSQWSAIAILAMIALAAALFGRKVARIGRG